MTVPAPTGGRRRLVVLRHGETTHNAAGIWQGHLDAPLSELGLVQAEAVGCAIAAQHPTRLLTSDLSRARLTAESVGRACGIPVEVDSRFREVHVGAWQGLSTDEIRDRWPEDLAAVRRGEDVRRGGDGESMQDVYVRVGEALDELLHGLPARECAVVSTHGAAARAMSAWLLGLDLGTAWRVLGGLGNCHWGEFHEGLAGWRLQAWNLSSDVGSRGGFPPP